MRIAKLKRKTADSFIFLHSEKIMAYEKIPELGPPLQQALDEYVEAGKVKVAGPVMWAYKSAGRGKLKLRAGYPVKPGSRGKGPIKAKAEGAWEVLSAEYKGSMNGIIDAWHELYEAAEERGLEPRDDRREIYRKWVAPFSKANVTELQLRIKKK